MKTRLLMVFCVLLGASEAVAQKALTLPLRFVGDVSPNDRALLMRSVVKGLEGGGLAAIHGARVARAIAPFGDKCAEDCRKALCGAFDSELVVGGEVKKRLRRYDVTLWGSRDGPKQVVVTKPCEICGASEVARLVQSAAATLATKMIRVQAKAKTSEEEVAAIDIHTKPPGAMVFVDYRPIGLSPCTVKLPAGKHIIEAEAGGYARLRREVVTHVGKPERVEVRLSRAVTKEKRSRWRKTAGWVALGTGIVLSAVGATLLAVNGRKKECRSGPMVDTCDERLDTLVGGGIALGLGGAGIVGGLYVLLTERGAATERRSAALAPRGLGIGYRRSF